MSEEREHFRLLNLEQCLPNSASIPQHFGVDRVPDESENEDNSNPNRRSR